MKLIDPELAQEAIDDARADERRVADAEIAELRAQVRDLQDIIDPLRVAIRELLAAENVVEYDPLVNTLYVGPATIGALGGEALLRALHRMARSSREGSHGHQG